LQMFFTTRGVVSFVLVIELRIVYAVLVNR
jgi:hypothetical protein